MFMQISLKGHGTVESKVCLLEIEIKKIQYYILKNINGEKEIKNIIYGNNFLKINYEVIKLNFNNIKNKYIHHLEKWKTLKN